MLWGPAGGYVSAIALRAAGAASSFRRPTSYACQYLAMARFEPVDLAVASLRRDRRSEALRVSMTQAGELIRVAQVWAMDGTCASAATRARTNGSTTRGARTSPRTG
jgi:hypothetical protein